jgi:hypothetical protein
MNTCETITQLIKQDKHAECRGGGGNVEHQSPVSVRHATVVMAVSFTVHYPENYEEKIYYLR